MIGIPEGYALALEVAERALDYTYYITSNYLGHGEDRRASDFRSARDFLDVGLGAVACIPSYFPSDRFCNVLGALRREIESVDDKLRCSELVRG